MPVLSDTAVVADAIGGEIDTVIIASSGSGYNNGTYENVPIKGDGVGGRVSLVVDGGRIVSATVTSGGSGYTSEKSSSMKSTVSVQVQDQAAPLR